VRNLFLVSTVKIAFVSVIMKIAYNCQFLIEKSNSQSNAISAQLLMSTAITTFLCPLCGIAAALKT